jgi:endonuclease G, mitochondrial
MRPMSHVTNHARRALALGGCATTLCALVAVYAIAHAVQGPQEPPRRGGEAPSGSAGSPHLALGVPAQTSPRSSGDDEVVVKPWYVLGFNRERRGADWAAWRLEGADLGRVERHAGGFFLDPTVPRRDQASARDYAGSHLDRGHLCPSADRTSTAEAQEGTFSFLNALPQEPELNRGPWEGLEKRVRELARGGRRVFVVDGPIWDPAREGAASSGSTRETGPGSLVEAPERTLGAEGLQVPAAFWKVAVVVCGSCGVADVSPGSEVIGVVMPNGHHLSPHWTTYRTTLGEVEHRSGYRLLGNVPEEVRARLRAKIDMAR